MRMKYDARLTLKIRVVNLALPPLTVVPVASQTITAGFAETYAARFCLSDFVQNVVWLFVYRT